MPQQIDHLSSIDPHRLQLKRQHMDELLALAEYLPKTDRVLIEQVLQSGLSISQIAKLSQTPARHLQRRSVSILKRLSNKLFIFVAIRIETLPTETRQTAKLVVIHGLSMRKSSKVSGLSLHTVRQHMNIVHATARMFI